MQSELSAPLLRPDDESVVILRKKPSMGAARKLALSKLPQNDEHTNKCKRSLFEDESDSMLIPLTINVGSHFKLRDGKLIKQLGLKAKKKHQNANVNDLVTVQEQAGSFFVRKFGTGISLYLKMLRYLSIVFLIQGLLGLPAIIFYARGLGGSESNSSDSDRLQSLGMSDLTLMNVRQTLSSNATSGSEPEDGNLWFGLSQSGMFTLLAYFDIASISFFVAASLVLIRKQREFDCDMDLIQTTPRDYAVYVRGLPAGRAVPLCDAQSVASHFERLLLSRMSPADAAEGNHKVAEVVLHRECRELLAKTQAIHKAEEGLRKAKVDRAHADAAPETTSPVKRSALAEKIKKLEETLSGLVKEQEVDLKIEKEVVCAFVTFCEDEGKNLALSIYDEEPRRERCLGPYAPEDPLKLFAGVHALEVERAREPDDILYENLETKTSETIVGRTLSAAVTLFVLALALAIIFSLSLEGKKRAAPSTEDCVDGAEYTKEMAEADGGLAKDCYCGGHVFSDPSFCKQIIIGALYKIIASFMTTSVNIFLAASIRKTASWQLWRSRSSEESAVLVGTFLAQFLNTAVVLVLVNLNWSQWLSWSILDGTPDNGFGFDWYKAVAIPVLTNMLTNSIVPHIILFCRKTFFRFQVWLKAAKAKSQEELDDLVGRRVSFTLAERFAFIITTVFVCNMFSAAVPVMPFLASWAFFVLYRFDKFNLLRYYTNVVDLKFDSQMALLTATVLPMSAVLHCTLSIIVWSDPWLQPYSITVARFEFTPYLYRIFLPNTFPLFLALCVSFVVCTCTNSEFVFNAIAPKCLKARQEEAGEDSPTWLQAISDAKAAGETMVFSYEVAKQPVYSQFFDFGDHHDDDVESGTAGIDEDLESAAAARTARKNTMESITTAYRRESEARVTPPNAEAQQAAVAAVFNSSMIEEVGDEEQQPLLSAAEEGGIVIEEEEMIAKTAAASPRKSFVANSEDESWIPILEADPVRRSSRVKSADVTEGVQDEHDDEFFDVVDQHKTRMNSTSSQESNNMKTPSGSYDETHSAMNS